MPDACIDPFNSPSFQSPSHFSLSLQYRSHYPKHIKDIYKQAIKNNHTFPPELQNRKLSQVHTQRFVRSSQSTRRLLHHQLTNIPPIYPTHRQCNPKTTPNPTQVLHQKPQTPTPAPPRHKHQQQEQKQKQEQISLIPNAPTLSTPPISPPALRFYLP